MYATTCFSKTGQRSAKSAISATAGAAWSETSSLPQHVRDRAPTPALISRPVACIWCTTARPDLPRYPFIVGAF
jgi:hypothetical protein